MQSATHKDEKLHQEATVLSGELKGQKFKYLFTPFVSEPEVNFVSRFLFFTFEFFKFPVEKFLFEITFA